MNFVYKNYFYIYNIKLMKGNILLIKKITFMFFVLFILKKLLTQLNMFFFVFENQNCFLQFSF